jgi:hypothetical protein
MKDEQRLEKIARDKIEKHLADALIAVIHHKAYMLGFDALVDAGVDSPLAKKIAQRVALKYDLLQTLQRRR